jgi:hypothetical protein
VVLGVRDLSELLRWEQRLADARLNYAVFVEPDRNDEKTAIAVHPACDPALFRNLDIL